MFSRSVLRVRPTASARFFSASTQTNGLLQSHLTRVRSGVKEVSVQDLSAALKDGPKSTFHLFDVRDGSEWNLGRIPKAFYTGRGNLERDIETYVPDTQDDIVLYCAGGVRSLLAADTLQKMGYTNVHSLAGGYNAWKAEGNAVTLPGKTFSERNDFLHVPSAVAASIAWPNVLAALHPNDSPSFIKELAQFLTVAKAGTRESLAGVSIRCRFAFRVPTRVAAVRPFAPLIVSNQQEWVDVEMGFNIANRDTLLVFVNPLGQDVAPSPTISMQSEDLLALRRLMEKQSLSSQHALAKPNLFLTMLDPSTRAIIYTSSTIKLSALRQNGSSTTGLHNLDFLRAHFDPSALARFENEMAKVGTRRNDHDVPQMFSFQHATAANPNSSDHETVFVYFEGVIFAITRVPLGSTSPVPVAKRVLAVAQNHVGPFSSASPSLSPPRSRTEGSESPHVPGKRAFRPWELDEDSHNSNATSQIPSISTILPAHVQQQSSPVPVRTELYSPYPKEHASKQHRILSGSALFQSHTADSDPMSPLLAAVQRVASLSSTTVDYTFPYPQAPTPTTTPTPDQSGLKSIQDRRHPISQPNVPSPILSSSTVESSPPQDHHHDHDHPPASTSSPPSLDDDEFINGGGSAASSSAAAKSRPMKPGQCQKCGVTSSREWRKGPQGAKTLCNACGLRFKRKPWGGVGTVQRLEVGGVGSFE
ncbi:hypothetical protein HDU98_009928 [Podochytrium sp. JEL0797]|nr:hypothetical protein HDU98_009928 [Podochytrium sp. JEL0797]